MSLQEMRAIGVNYTMDQNGKPIFHTYVTSQNVTRSVANLSQQYPFAQESMRMHVFPNGSFQGSKNLSAQPYIVRHTTQAERDQFRKHY